MPRCLFGFYIERSLTSWPLSSLCFLWTCPIRTIWGVRSGIFFLFEEKGRRSEKVIVAKKDVNPNLTHHMGRKIWCSVTKGESTTDILIYSFDWFEHNLISYLELLNIRKQFFNIFENVGATKTLIVVTAERISWENCLKQPKTWNGKNEHDDLQKQQQKNQTKKQTKPNHHPQRKQTNPPRFIIRSSLRIKQLYLGDITLMCHPHVRWVF